MKSTPRSSSLPPLGPPGEQARGDRAESSPLLLEERDDRLVIRSLDNCSVTVIDIADGRLVLVEGGEEADTLIR